MTNTKTRKGIIAGCYAASGVLILAFLAATTEFPLGLPLRAREEAIVPLDVTIGFDDLPNLGDALLRAAIGSAVAYRLDGRVQVDAGQLGQPTFGPMTILQGDLRVAR